MVEGYDLTSWGTDSVSNKSAVLISPIHFVSARHYHPPVGSEIVFSSGESQFSGVILNYQIIPDTDIGHYHWKTR